MDQKVDGGRLASLDILRGLDIFFLTVLSGLVVKFNKFVKLPKWLMDQLIHPAWEGFTAYDMIMPLFIFMCGAALPLALPRRLGADGRPGWPYWRHVLSRVALLWGLGLFVQGELLSFDLHRISFFNNTLQTIAVGYIAAACVMLIRRRWVRIAIPFALAALYTAFLHLCGDLTPTGNAAVVYEVKFLSLFYPDATWHPVSQISSWHYTWWTTVPMFAVMGLAGFHATKILLSGLPKPKKAATMAICGLGLLVLGAALSTFDPVVKHIFTASFTSYAMGVSFLLYALCYYLFDIVCIRRGTWLLKLFGQRSLLAYVLSCSVVASVLSTAAGLPLSAGGKMGEKGLSRFFAPETHAFLRGLVSAAILVFVLWLWNEFRRLRRKAAAAPEGR